MPPKKPNNKRKNDQKEVKIPTCPMNITDKGPHKKFLINYMEFIKLNNPHDANKLEAVQIILTDCFDTDWQAFLDYRAEQDKATKEERERKKAEKEAKENEEKSDNEENEEDDSENVDDDKEEATADLLTRLKKTTSKLERNMTRLRTPKDRELFEENVLASVSTKISKVLVKTDKVVPVIDQVISVMKEVAGKIADKQLTENLKRAKAKLKRCVRLIDKEHNVPSSPDDIASPPASVGFNVSNQGSPQVSPVQISQSNPNSTSTQPTKPNSTTQLSPHHSESAGSSPITDSHRKHLPELHISSPH